MTYLRNHYPVRVVTYILLVLALATAWAASHAVATAQAESCRSGGVSVTTPEPSVVYTCEEEIDVTAPSGGGGPAGGGSSAQTRGDGPTFGEKIVVAGKRRSAPPISPKAQPAKPPRKAGCPAENLQACTDQAGDYKSQCEMRAVLECAICAAGTEGICAVPCGIYAKWSCQQTYKQNVQSCRRLCF